jgi:hypothetical protein
MMAKWTEVRGENYPPEWQAAFNKLADAIAEYYGHGFILGDDVIDVGDPDKVLLVTIKPCDRFKRIADQDPSPSAPETGRFSPNQTRQWESRENPPDDPPVCVPVE